MIVTVRQAKASLSRLLDEAAAGEEIVITCDGRPKARLVGLADARVPFRVNWNLIRRPSSRKGAKSADDLVREDRDSRD
jgi:prevent-host-death family protein